jgi:chloramphenicol O-acetyltransferase type A
MSVIDLSTWPRREHFETFRTFHDPWFNMCAEVDLTVFRPAVKAADASFTAAIVYVITRAANEIPEFRCRIQGDDVIEHDVVHPATTILRDGGLFTFCHFDYDPDFTVFGPHAVSRMAHFRDEPTLENLPGDDLLYMTAIPWVSFTSFSHPMPHVPGDSIPRFAWGKFVEAGEKVKMPLSVQGHHALMDGLHVGEHYALVQDYLDHPETFLGEPEASQV